jgi:uncharacterized protein YbaP (TraB family)
MEMNKQFLVTGIVLIVVIVAVTLAYVLFQNENDNSKKYESENQIYDVTKEPFLWRIEGQNPSYMFGSIHLPDERVLTLPDIIVEAIDEVGAVITEVKLDTETQILADQLSKLPSGQTIDDLLPLDVASRLDSYLRTKGLSLSLLSQYKIWAITSTIVFLDELVNLIENPSLDQYIWNTAISSGKYTNGIETVQEQIDIFDSFSIDEQIEMLEGTLDELEYYANTGGSITDDMLKAYIDGNLEVLQDLVLSGIDENDPLDVKFINNLLTNRNYNMTQRISQLITDNPDTQYFFTIGAGHYYGDDGLIKLLEDEGFTITRVAFSECKTCDSGEVLIENRCYVPYE